MLKETKRARRVVDIVVNLGNPNTKLYVNHSEKIRLKETDNALKIIVSREISNFLNAPSRYWSFNGSIDKNSQRIADHLTARFPDYTWIVNHSQGVFDILSLDAKVAIEIKSTKVGSKTLVTNASVYPDKVRAGSIFGDKGYDYKGYDPDADLDVIVVCVERTATDKVHNFAIVDGSYWGVTSENFDDCQAMFCQLNDPSLKVKIYKLLVEEFGNEFVSKLVDGGFNGAIDLNFRKLITIKNPVGKLDHSPSWTIN